ncbi:hypothetical protein CDV36_016358, partial [Fusarium kuroshium]
MPREKPVGVPIDEIRRTLDDLDGRRTGNRAGGRSGPPHSIIPDSSASQSTHHHQPRQEPVRVTLDEIRRTLEDLDRQHAETLARRRQKPSRSTIARQLASQTRTQSEQQPIRVRPGEVAHAWDDIQRQRAEERDRRAQAVARRNTVTVPEDELRRTMAAITQRHAEERLREITARLRPQQDTGQVDRRGAEEVCRTQPPATPERISSSPQVSIPQAIPQTPQTRKRPREPQPGGLLTPPPTRPGRPRKRPRSSQETALLQR